MTGRPGVVHAAWSLSTTPVAARFVLKALAVAVGILMGASCAPSTSPTVRETEEPIGATTVLEMKPTSGLGHINMAAHGCGTAFWKCVVDGTSLASNDGDTTYVESTASGGSHKVAYSGAPVGAVTEVRVHTVAAREAGAAGTMTVHLYASGKLLGTGAAHEPTTTYAEYSDTFNVSAASANTLQTEVVFSTENLKYTEIWLEVTLAAAGPDGGTRDGGGHDGDAHDSSTSGDSGSGGMPWAKLLDPGRAIDWSHAGASIAHRTTICSTPACNKLSTTVSGSGINAAIASAPANSVVLLPAGTFTIEGGITFAGHGDVTLRGAGASQTTLSFTSGDSCNGLGGDICVIDNTAYFSGSGPVQPGGTNAHEWTAGFAKGTTQLTLDSATGLSVGTMIIVDQADDTVDNGGLFVCDAPNCHQVDQTGSYNGRTVGGVDRNQTQVAIVTAISGNTITISTPLYASNWRSGQRPGIWWPGQIEGVGIEDLTVDNTGSGSTISSGIYFYDCYDCWVDNVRSIRANRNHVYLYQGSHITVRDSYFFGTQNSTDESYGIEDYISSDCLIENNVFQQVASPKVGAGASGLVFGYNFAINDLYTTLAAWNLGTYFAHDAGNAAHLFEGNELNSIESDDLHGVGGSSATYFRNQLTGRGYNGVTAPATLTSNGTGPIVMNYGWRGVNVIGNVLGYGGYFTQYQVSPGVGDAEACQTSIYALGFGTVNCGSGTPGSDALVASTMLRWGNYDTVNDAVRFVASEVPTTGVPFIDGNFVPATQTLPASLYLSAKPSFWGTMPWPAIGPDVTGGTVTAGTSSLGGHAYPIPARACYTNVMAGPADGSGGALEFDAKNCYPN
jgi:hypothetical protein